MSRSFPGTTGNYYEAANSSAYTTPTVGTIGVWVKTSQATSGTYQGIVGKADAVASDSGWVIVAPNTTSGVTISIKDGSANTVYGPNFSSPVINDGKWHYITLVFSRTSGQRCQTYVDGTALDSGQTAAFSWTFSNDVIRWGQQLLAFWGNCVALIADTAWWSAALTTQEIVGLASGVRPYQIRSSNLIGWWPFDGLVSTEPDLSGTANNASLNGTVTSAFGPPFTTSTPRWRLPTPLTLPPVFILMPQIVM
jgi:hypothetical protein